MFITIHFVPHIQSELILNYNSLLFRLGGQFIFGDVKYNITPFYKISDLLLTEASSTIYEMLALGKPVVINRFFKLKLSHRIFKYRLYRKRLNKEMSSDISKFCFEVDRPASIPKIIEEAFARNENCKHEIKEFQDKMLYKLDGKASERARDAILSKLHKSNRC